ncbi:DNA internalization-related competence protein ComEC/Rec2 [Salinicola endophyticus]|uniref:DNA internalization-related competence protein ComEC/Rec2 n=1 Tax=Salinicola endophyticus TaxID=1949083 RepID=UPI001FD9795F|nr:DNA internalization-related competence protein ComEC/Rec2 [Salinicola endophyticus]
MMTALCRAWRPGLAMPLALAAIGGALAGEALPAATGMGLALLGVLLLLGAMLARATGWTGRRGLVGGGLCLLVAAWCALVLAHDRAGRLGEALAGQEFRLRGVVENLARDGRRTRFELGVTRCEALAQDIACPPLGRVRLSWYADNTLVAGERWVLTARLRPPLGFTNPDTFDYAAWLRRERIHALGYVRATETAQRLAPAAFSLRQAALDSLAEVPMSALGKRWLAALTLGAGAGLTSDDWALLNATGTTHLMVISGLHVGMVAALVLWLLRRLARWLVPDAWRLTGWPWAGAALAAFAYAGLAGFAPPTLRAALMTAIGLWVASGRHAPGWWQAWWLALALVVITDPMAPWLPGVWLSFTAVAVLILAWSGRPRPRGVRGWCLALLRTQWLLAPVMAAAVLLAFGRLAPAAPLINLLAVPVVGSLMVPLGFCGWLLVAWPMLAGWVWAPFDLLARSVAAALAWSAQVVPLWQPAAWWHWPLALALLLWALLWLLPGLATTLRLWGGVLLLVSVALLRAPLLPPGTLVVTVYDVGQGQLVELRSRHQRVLVDAGPRFGSGFMPLTLLWPPDQHFDAVVVTHSDRDHAGGVPALRAQHRVDRWWAPRGNTLGLPSRPCVAGEAWRADGASWRFLSPPADAEALSRNDRSCVLLVTLGSRRVLITGDAGVAIERHQLLPRLGVGRIDLLVAGHHGSATSSAPSFVAATRPREVVFSSGRGNPFGHPRPAVVARFQAVGSRIWNTAYDGAVRFVLSASGIEVETQRHPGWSRRATVDAGDVGVESSP